MQVWQQQLSDLYDQLAEYASDWPECIEMATEPSESPELCEYLGLLTVRAKKMQRRFNYTSMIRDGAHKIWRIHNYTYKMWRALISRCPDKIVVTPFYIAVPDEILTPELREKFRKHLIA